MKTPDYSLPGGLAVTIDTGGCIWVVKVVNDDGHADLGLFRVTNTGLAPSFHAWSNRKWKPIRECC